MEASLAPPALAEAAQPMLEQLQGARADAGELLKTWSGKLKASIKAIGPAGSIYQRR